MYNVFDFISENPVSGAGFMYKSTTEAFFYDGSSVTPIRQTASFVATTGTGTSVMNISEVVSGEVKVGMTVSGGTLSGTATISSFGTFDGISGTVNLSASQTFANPTTVTGLKVSDADYPSETVRGVVYLDGTYYVMTPNGSIQGSEINDPLTWSALNVIQCQAEPDGGVCLSRLLNLVVAFNTNSTEFFYDAGNPVGSPLLPYSSAFIEIGCAAAGSVAQTDNTLYFLGVTKQKGRGIYRFNGTNPQYVSNTFVDKLLNADDLSDVNAFCIRIAGHAFYILVLGDTQKTLVLDATTSEWAVWTILGLSGIEVTPSSAVWANRELVLEGNFSDYEDGDRVQITGFTPLEYNGQFTINKNSDSEVTIYFQETQGIISTIGTIDRFVESPFTLAFYTSGSNFDVVQDSTTGLIYFLDSETYTDNANPIKTLIRTMKFDWETNDKKFIAQLEIIGDKVESTAYVRYTNDDYQTYSKYRPVDLNAQRSLLNRIGQQRRRAYEIVHYDNTPLRLETIELNQSQGTN